MKLLINILEQQIWIKSFKKVFIKKFNKKPRNIKIYIINWFILSQIIYITMNLLNN